MVRKYDPRRGFAYEVPDEKPVEVSEVNVSNAKPEPKPKLSERVKKIFKRK